MRSWMEDGLSPYEWAARHAQDIGSWSGDRYRYDDPAVDAWVRGLAGVLGTAGALDACRRHFLTPDELNVVLEREAEEF